MRTRFYAMAFAAVLAVVMGGATQVAVHAAGNSCFEKRVATGSHTIQKVFLAGGWGWTNWPVRASVFAVDSCNRGTINVSIHLPESAVDQKGGAVNVQGVYVRYFDKKTMAAGNWIRLKHAPYLSSQARDYVFVAPNGQSISMNDTTMTWMVAIQTAAWTRQDGSNWVGLGSGWVVCQLAYTTPGSPGSCSGT
jgi:hypothetical protein